MNAELENEYLGLIKEFAKLTVEFDTARAEQFQKEKETALINGDNEALNEIRDLEKKKDGLPKQSSRKMIGLQHQAKELAERIKAYNGPVKVYSTRGNQTQHLTGDQIKKAAKK